MKRVLGIDVSKHQKKIDWKKVADAGIKFVFIRVGYRGYGKKGTLNVDPYFEYNMKEALKYGIKVGVYFYSQAKNREEAIEEAMFVLRLIEPYKDQITLPVIFDFEGFRNILHRVFGMTKKQITEVCLAFQELIKAQGYTCLLYGSKAHIASKFDFDKLDDYLWVAKYASKTKPLSDEKYFPVVKGVSKDRIAVWQFASCGKVNGISGNVDMDYMYIDVSTDKAFSQEKEEVNEPMVRMYKKGVAVQLAPNFKSTEFDCNGKGCCSETPIHDTLIFILQKLREYLGKSVKLNCGFRCEIHNAKVSGASKNSQHLRGFAADIVVKGVHPVRIGRILDKLFDEYGIEGRIGIYTWNDKGDGFVHVDVRGTNKRAVYTQNNTDYDTVSKFFASVKYGTKGKTVTVVERFLAAQKYCDEKGKSHKYYDGKIDENCGPKLEQAIIRWNADHGRPDDASWGPKCWNEAFPY